MEPPFYSEDDKGVIAERLEISVDEATDLLGSIESTVKLFLDLDAKDNTISNHTALELRTRVMTVVSTVTALERAIGEAETALDDLTPALDYLQQGRDRYPQALQAVRSIKANVAPVTALRDDAQKVSRGKLPSGAPKDRAAHYLIKELAHIYSDATGRAPSVTWDPYKKEYRGPFLDFVKACLDPLGEPNINNWYMRHIQESNLPVSRLVNRLATLDSKFFVGPALGSLIKRALK